ncbi:MAG TPA: molybdopterin-dependent oxidoreductase [Bryobacteraceae bacterium]|jgi:anaerobic selenocysteine-containing dehydrogenase|nr:molybdopterin-dependent oxidoreductase [Bryobacteraceae bacterium]
MKTSVCALDCPDTCSLHVTVDASGRATKLRGNPDHPVTRGFLCGKVAQYLERQYHPDRLLHPLRRLGAKGEGRFSQITWDEALDEIAARLKAIAAEHGSEAILPYSYAGTMGLLNGAGMDRRFFHRLGASRLDRTICSSAGGTALMLSQGCKLGTEPEQFAQSKLILAWGANVLGTNVHLWPWIVEARRNGAKFYVIDPVRNRTGRLADRHYAIHPGSDLALALGMIHVILREGLQDDAYIQAHTTGFAELEELSRCYTPCRVAELTGIGAPDIETLAREYATTRPAAIRVNYGVQRSERGGSAVRAIAALPVMTGSWREAGGGLQLTTSGAFEFNRAALERPDLQWRSELKREARLVNMSRLGHALNELGDPRVHAMVVYNSNPASIAPDQRRVLAGLRREDLFTVVLEQFQTDTVDHADIVLPSTTFLEHTDLYLAYGHYYVQMARPALAPLGEAKPNVEIFRLLAKRMGFDDPCFDDSEDDMMRALLDTSSPYLDGVTFERLDREHFVRLNVSTPGEPFMPFEAGGFRTLSGRFEFGAESLKYTPPAESRLGDVALRNQFPFELISSKNDDSMNSTFGHRASTDAQTSVVEMHPEDARLLQITQGMPVRIFNHRGECYFQAQLTDRVARGVLRCPTMRWNRASKNRQGVNMLTSDRLTDLGNAATFYSCLVAVEPALTLFPTT